MIDGTYITSTLYSIIDSINNSTILYGRSDVLSNILIYLVVYFVLVHNTIRNMIHPIVLYQDH